MFIEFREGASSGTFTMRYPEPQTPAEACFRVERVGAPEEC